MSKCFVCECVNVFMCEMCGTVFCSEHGDTELLLCDDCVQYESIVKEENEQALDIEFSTD
ncbi:MAG: hypothetical protein PHW96_04205 [Candidatus Nanoarchaeia archaeon]|nr:hypothetical protein [Candidatus Nanoarchaeia archaeon]